MDKMNKMSDRIHRILLIPSKIRLFLSRPGRDSPQRHKESIGAESDRMEGGGITPMA